MADRRWQRSLEFHILRDAIPARQQDGHLHPHPGPSSATTPPRSTSTACADTSASSSNTGTSTDHLDDDTSTMGGTTSVGHMGGTTTAGRMGGGNTIGGRMGSDTRASSMGSGIDHYPTATSHPDAGNDDAGTSHTATMVLSTTSARHCLLSWTTRPQRLNFVVEKFFN